MDIQTNNDFNIETYYIASLLTDIFCNCVFFLSESIGTLMNSHAQFESKKIDILLKITILLFIVLHLIGKTFQNSCYRFLVLQ